MTKTRMVTMIMVTTKSLIVRKVKATIMMRAMKGIVKRTGIPIRGGINKVEQMQDKKLMNE